MLDIDPNKRREVWEEITRVLQQEFEGLLKSKPIEELPPVVKVAVRIQFLDQTPPKNP